MESGYRPIPSLFWNRLVLVAIFITGAYLGLKFLPKYFHFLYFMDQSLVFALALIVGIIAWHVFFRVVENPFFTAAIPLMFLFWLILDRLLLEIAVSPKPHYMATGFILAGGVVILYKNFRYLWGFQMARFLMIFALVNIIYYFFHSSDFNISAEGFTYGWHDGSHGKDARFIVFIDSLTSLFAFCVPAALFSGIQSGEQLRSCLHKIWNIFFIGFIIYFVLFPITIKCLPTGKQLFVPLNFFFFLSLKLFIDNYYKKSNMYNLFSSLVLAGVGLLSIYSANKTALVGFIVSLGFFLFLNRNSLKFSFHTVKIPRQKYLTPIFILISLVAAYFIADQLGITDKIIKVINKSVTAVFGNSGINSWYIRQSNWNYFILDWKNNLDFFSAVFGFGLGASREVIFYISAMQYSRIYLVQTTHNQFTEMLYDYGLVSLLFYVPVITIFIKDVFNVLSGGSDRLSRLFSLSSASMIIFMSIYHITDGLRLGTTIIFFSFIAFNEMVKHTLLRYNRQKIEAGCD